MLPLLAWLRKVPSAVYVYTAVGLAIIASYAQFVHYQRDIGRREVQLSQAIAELQSAKKLADSLEKAYKVDTVYLNKWRTRWDTAKAGVDTQWLADTTPVPVKVVKELIYIADTTIKACTEALSTCEQRVGAEKKGRIAAEKEVQILKKALPGAFAPWRDRIIGGVIGAALIQVLRK